MIALIKTFTLQQTSAVSEHFHGTSSISSAFAVKINRLSDLGGNRVASSFALATSAVSEHLPGDNKVASSFALAHGGYELDGVILAKKLEKTKLIRQK